MQRLIAALVGIAAFVIVAVGAGLFAIFFGYAPMAADGPRSDVEADLAMKAVHAVSERAMGTVKNPLPLDAEHLLAGLRTYQQNCVLCHGAADGKPSKAAAGFSAPSPQFATDGAEDDPEGATFWKIHYGIRFTAMPAYGKSLSDTQIWQLVLFLKHMDALPKSVDLAWKATPSMSAPGDASPKASPAMRATPK